MGQTKVVINPRIRKGEGKGEAVILDHGIEQAGRVTRDARGDTVHIVFPIPLDRVPDINGKGIRRKNVFPPRTDIYHMRRSRSLLGHESEQTRPYCQNRE